jgi:outer membrane receptor protein involved in Fe transport
MSVKQVYGLMLGASLGLPFAAMAEDTVTTPAATVVGVTPLLGTGIDINKVPSNVQVITPSEQRQMNPGSAADMLDNALGSISADDYEGNPLQESLNFRGFSASPLMGQAQGLAVYQNGMRVNEAFGDLVLWDLMPSFAIGRIQVMPGSNPVFGLNALGGAIAMKMKDGFTDQGNAIELGGGSFGRYKATVETGHQWDDLAFYAGVSGMHDDGWRDRSPSQALQSYTDLAVRHDKLDAGLGLTVGTSSLTGNGGTPGGMLAQDWSSVFTSPDLQQNTLAALNLRLGYQITDSTSAQGSVYYRHLRTGLHNGNTLNTANCNNADCMTTSGLDLNFTAYNADLINSMTSTDSFGFAGQVTHDRKLFGLDNVANAGASSDVGFTRYTVNTEVGTLTSNRSVTGSGMYLANGQGFNANLNAVNQYYGVYFTDTLSLTERLHWTLSGRYNLAMLDLTDLAGQGLTGQHRYDRFNPATGLTYQFTSALTGYVSYAEANRAPTAAELGCSDPNAPCTVQSALNSDPPLKQVVSRSVELGARGRHDLGEHRTIGWSRGGFWTRNYDDIIFVMTNPTSGQGYFNNAGITAPRDGGIYVDGTFGALKVMASYAYTLATFASYNELPSSSNVAANGSGQIDVVPGDRMPGIPLHSIKLAASYAVTDALTVGADTKISSQRTLLGDESGTMNKLGAINVVNASVSYLLKENAQLSFRVQNLFDQRYATTGTVADPSAGGAIANTSSNNTFLVPGEPRSFWGGLRVTF